MLRRIKLIGRRNRKKDTNEEQEEYIKQFERAINTLLSNYNIYHPKFEVESVLRTFKKIFELNIQPDEHCTRKQIKSSLKKINKIQKQIFKLEIHIDQYGSDQHESDGMGEKFKRTALDRLKSMINRTKDEISYLKSLIDEKRRKASFWIGIATFVVAIISAVAALATLFI